MDRDAQLEVEDIENWERNYGPIPEGAILIMFSGTGQHYGNRTAYFGWPSGMEQNNPNDTENLHFPGISSKAAEWLVTYRTIYGTGVDTASGDYGQSRDFKTHQIFGEHNNWGIENLNNVDKLPPKGFLLYNMVTKIRDGSGGPSRVIAILDNSSNGGSFKTKPSAILSMMLSILILHKLY